MQSGSGHTPGSMPLVELTDVDFGSDLLRTIHSIESVGIRHRVQA